jgi:hypothetical protein
MRSQNRGSHLENDALRAPLRRCGQLPRPNDRADRRPSAPSEGVRHDGQAPPLHRRCRQSSTGCCGACCSHTSGTRRPK